MRRVAALLACAVVLGAGAQPFAASESEIRTRHAIFRPARFADLPGWTDDDLATAWDAWRDSCKELARREVWREVCARSQDIAPDPAQRRRFFEQEFALFRILNTDASREGDVTGYYEPTIAGDLRPRGAFVVPVYGVPNDLFTIDWKTIPPAQRQGTLFVVKSGRRLAVVPTRTTDSFALDTTRFGFDTRDRTWRVRLDGDTALPYPARADIAREGHLDAPVIAYVADPVALYAMQVQGAGRIRLPDGTTLRVRYAEQNGQPFKPLRLVAGGGPPGRTRGGAADADRVESFELAGPDTDAPDDGIAPGIRTRGLPSGDDASTPPPAAGPGRDAASDALVEQLLASSRAAKAPPASKAQARAPQAASVPATPVASAPARTAPPAPPAPPSSSTSDRTAALDADPSYVFFRVATDQSLARGPVGAFGVPLTAGRSIAVDPRVTPLGYPVYVAGSASASVPSLQGLEFAQDTGGAVRGAVRADLFRGSGADAGREALRVRQRASMWLMLPHAEAERLQHARIATRGSGALVEPGCLVADGTFCSDAD